VPIPTFCERAMTDVAIKNASSKKFFIPVSFSEGSIQSRIVWFLKERI
jgi:hypothetical protein